MGTPDFAVPSLQILHEAGYNIVGVITSTDKFGGRGGKQLIESAVKKYAVKHQLKVLQPKNLKAPAFVEELRALQADIQVVVAFRMLPVIVWNMPEMGTMNLHGSLLPKYRGAAPIHWAVINGESETGVTSFFLKHEIDTGDMLFQEKLAIGENETTGDIHDRMMHLGAQVVLKSIQAVETGEYTLLEQDNSLVTKAPKLFTEHCEIDFRQSTATVHNFIRGLSPYPAAWTTLEGQKLKIFRTTKDLSTPVNVDPGQFISDNKNFIKVATKDGFVEIHELQIAGRRRMNVKDFLNGFEFS